MGETSRPWIERIFWMIAFIISTIGCALLIAEMFEKLQTNPITVSLAERPSSIQEASKRSFSKAQPARPEAKQSCVLVGQG
jgi:Amiloride-sensitive sodium channel